ncbi:MAG: NFACT family protein, partial [Bacteroidales bacterium]|nr:NFACT family protein [Bacteroidales bacterium]
MSITLCFKFIDFSQSTVRQIIPGLTYRLPEPQNKISPLDFSESVFYQKSAECQSEKSAEKFIVGVWGGIATLIARELVYRASGRTDTTIGEINKEKLCNVMLSWQKSLSEHEYTPTVAIDDSGKPID